MTHESSSSGKKEKFYSETRTHGAAGIPGTRSTDWVKRSSLRTLTTKVFPNQQHAEHAKSDFQGENVSRKSKTHFWVRTSQKASIHNTVKWYSIRLALQDQITTLGHRSPRREKNEGMTAYDTLSRKLRHKNQRWQYVGTCRCFDSFSY